MSPVEDFLSTPCLGVSNTRRNSILKDCILPGPNMPAKDVFTPFPALPLGDCPSGGLCLCFEGNGLGKKTNVCQLLPINDTQTFQLVFWVCVFVCGSRGI